MCLRRALGVELVEAYLIATVLLGRVHRRVRHGERFGGVLSTVDGHHADAKTEADVAAV